MHIKAKAYLGHTTFNVILLYLLQFLLENCLWEVTNLIKTTNNNIVSVVTTHKFSSNIYHQNKERLAYYEITEITTKIKNICIKSLI